MRMIWNQFLTLFIGVLFMSTPLSAQDEFESTEESSDSSIKLVLQKHPYILDFLKNPIFDGLAQAIGFYSQGTLQDALEFNHDGNGYVKLFKWREFHFTTIELTEIVQNSASLIKEKFPQGERLQIGDFSGKTGGHIIGHDSHQNGLDVDLSYYDKQFREQDSNINEFQKSYVFKNLLHEDFDIERNWLLIKTLVDTDKINRIFVDPVIKKAFCDFSKKSGEYNQRIETLRKLRPWQNHADHLHVRLQCPKESPQCITQSEPPIGSGCDL